MTQETLKKLAQLLEQDQFELILPENVQPDETKTEGEGARGRDIRLGISDERCSRKLSCFSKCQNDGGISQ